MTKAILTALGNEIEEALQDIAKKHNVQIRRGNGTYGETNATLKLEISDISEDGSVLDKEAETFLSMATIYGFKPDDLNRVFISNGDKYSITGMNPRRSKYPISAIRLRDGGKYKFTVVYTKLALAREVAQ